MRTPPTLLAILLVAGCTGNTAPPSDDGEGYVDADAGTPDPWDVETGDPDPPYDDDVVVQAEDEPDPIPGEEELPDEPVPGEDFELPAEPSGAAEVVCPFMPGAEPQKKALFTTRHPDKDFTLENELVRLLLAAVPGSRVRISVFTFSRLRMANAIIAAHRRGVDVRVIVDEHNLIESPRGSGHFQYRLAVQRLRDELGREGMILCNENDPPNGGACIGSGINHNKIFLFSELCDGSRNVVVQSSANLTRTQLTLHNNMIVVRDDADLFSSYERYFDDLARQRRDLSYYRSESGDTGTQAYFFPRSSGDTLHHILTREIDCSHGGEIRVAMAFWTSARTLLVDDLRALADDGCDVRFVVSERATTRSVQRHIKHLFGPRHRVRGPGIHHKYLLVDAIYRGSRRQLVFTGSHNYTGGALRRNDETLLRVDDPDVYAAFRADWQSIYRDLR